MGAPPVAWGLSQPLVVGVVASPAWRTRPLCRLLQVAPMRHPWTTRVRVLLLAGGAAVRGQARMKRTRACRAATRAPCGLWLSDCGGSARQTGVPARRRLQLLRPSSHRPPEIWMRRAQTRSQRVRMQRGPALPRRQGRARARCWFATAL